MKLKLDSSKTYAIALEGGGAKGAYEIGAWMALDEAGIRYSAVSGTSVGALNGALMAMRDLSKAIDVWRNIQLTDVMNLTPEEDADLRKLFAGSAGFSDFHDLLDQVRDVIRNRGIDVSPLRAWVREVVDPAKVKASDVDLYVCTVSLSDKKGLEIHVNDLPENEICDMLLASAYHPSFRLEKLGGKLYTDGGFIDSLPLHVLVENGYKDIIAIRIPGMGRERHFRIPDDVQVTYVETFADLGSALNFDAAQSRRDMLVGYFDTMRVLYGLTGRNYYVERTIPEREALDWLLDARCLEDVPLRDFFEKEFPKLAKRLDAGGSYYELMLAVLEREAEAAGVPSMRILTDRQLLAETLVKMGHRITLDDTYAESEPRRMVRETLQSIGLKDENNH